MVLWVLVVAPLWPELATLQPETTWVMAGVLGNLAVFGGLARLGTAASGNRTVMRAIAALFLLALVWGPSPRTLAGGRADVRPTPSPSTRAGCLGFVAVGLLALHPSMRRITVPAGRRRKGPSRRPRR